jgi:hypothetical protein
MSDLNRFTMPPRQVEKPPVKQGNQQRVDSFEMPPRTGGKLPAKPFNSGRQKFSGSSSGKQYHPNAITDVRNQPESQKFPERLFPSISGAHQPPLLQQSNPRPGKQIYHSSYYESRPFTGGAIRNERMPVARGSPYNIPHPQTYSNSRAQMPAPSLGHQQRFPAGTTTSRNNATNSFSSSRGSDDVRDEYLKITVSDDCDSAVTINKTYSQPASDLQKRVEALEEKQHLLLKEIEANKKGLKIKDVEIQDLSQIIEDQKSKLNKRDDTRSSNSQNEHHNYRVSNRNDYEEDGDEMHDTTPTTVATGSINAMFAKAQRNQSMKQI